VSHGTPVYGCSEPKQDMTDVQTDCGAFGSQAIDSVNGPHSH